MVSMPESDTAPKLDDETTAALTLFNEYVEADRERTQREKRIKKAERAKDEAAALVKKLNERGSAEEKAEAEAAYRVAADRWKKLRDGEEPDDPAAAEAETPTEDAAPAEAEAEAPEPAQEPAATHADDEEEPPAEAASDEEE
jgi:S-DNA-T family DNA segregation ATPase FtsK/SpoIIIE